MTERKVIFLSDVLYKRPKQKKKRVGTSPLPPVITVEQMHATKMDLGLATLMSQGEDCKAVLVETMRSILRPVAEVKDPSETYLVRCDIVAEGLEAALADLQNFSAKLRGLKRKLASPFKSAQVSAKPQKRKRKKHKK